MKKMEIPVYFSICQLLWWKFKVMLNVGSQNGISYISALATYYDTYLRIDLLILMSKSEGFGNSHGGWVPLKGEDGQTLKLELNLAETESAGRNQKIWLNWLSCLMNDHTWFWCPNLQQKGHSKLAANRALWTTGATHSWDGTSV